MKIKYFFLPIILSLGFSFFFVLNHPNFKSNHNSDNIDELIVLHNEVTENTTISKNTVISFNFDIDIDNAQRIITFDIPVEHLFWVNDSFSYKKFKAFSHFIKNIIYTNFFSINIYNQNDIVLSRNVYYTYSYNPDKIPFISFYNKNEDGDGLNTPLSTQQFSEFKLSALKFATSPESKKIIKDKFNNINSQLISLTENYYTNLKSGNFFKQIYSLELIKFFEIVNSQQRSFPNEIIAKLENKYDTELALKEFKLHYEYINTLDFKDAILNFKYSNFIKLPPNDNDVCFVKVPDNVSVDFYTVGQVKFISNEYTLEPYSCAGGLNIQ